MSTTRRPFVAGNWKMNPGLRAEAVTLATGVASSTVGARQSVDVGVFPAFVHLEAVGHALREAAALADASVTTHGGWTGVALGAQDAYFEEKGAFTGEVSLGMLRDLGVSMVLVGHSERRHVIGEDDALLNRKARAVLEAGMVCVLCIGETLEQREAGETDAVNERQLKAGLEGVSLDSVERLVIAYEPVWAIGTGKTATPGDAQAAHERVRSVLGELFGGEAAGAIRVQYGGSMKPDNAGELVGQGDIDGGLIGGASLKADSFAAIVDAAAGVAAG